MLQNLLFSKATLALLPKKPLQRISIAHGPHFLTQKSIQPLSTCNHLKFLGSPSFLSHSSQRFLSSKRKPQHSGKYGYNNDDDDTEGFEDFDESEMEEEYSLESDLLEEEEDDGLDPIDKAAMRREMNRRRKQEEEEEYPQMDDNFDWEAGLTDEEKSERSRQKADEVNRNYGIIINELITSKKVRVVPEKDQKFQNSVLETSKAIKLAAAMKLDLVQIVPPKDDQPPICKIIPYGKYRYELEKKEKASKSAVIKVKEVQFGQLISEHDLEHKLDQVMKFLGESRQVKVSVKAKVGDIELPKAQTLYEQLFAKLRPHATQSGVITMKSNALTVTIVPGQKGPQLTVDPAHFAKLKKQQDKEKLIRLGFLEPGQEIPIGMDVEKILSDHRKKLEAAKARNKKEEKRKGRNRDAIFEDEPKIPGEPELVIPPKGRKYGSSQILEDEVDEDAVDIPEAPKKDFRKPYQQSKPHFDKPSHGGFQHHNKPHGGFNQSQSFQHKGQHQQDKPSFFDKNQSQGGFNKPFQHQNQNRDFKPQSGGFDRNQNQNFKDSQHQNRDFKPQSGGFDRNQNREGGSGYDRNQNFKDNQNPNFNKNRSPFQQQQQGNQQQQPFNKFNKNNNR